MSLLVLKYCRINGKVHTIYHTNSLEIIEDLESLSGLTLTSTVVSILTA